MRSIEKVHSESTRSFTANLPAIENLKTPSSKHCPLFTNLNLFSTALAQRIYNQWLLRFTHYLCPSPTTNSNLQLHLTKRPRRLRRNPSIRSLVQETHLSVDDLIYPMFVMEGENQRVEIPSMPGCYRYTLDLLLAEVAELYTLGVKAVALFPVVSESKKDDDGTESYNPEGLAQNTVRAIKAATPDTIVITDVALDPFTTHGHDGVIDEHGVILNDETVDILVKMSISQAQAGCDMVAPSDMMDGRIGAIRQGLDAHGFTDVGILAYSAKYASAYYGPFRDALDSAPKFGDKKTYQMDPAQCPGSSDRSRTGYC